MGGRDSEWNIVVTPNLMHIIHRYLCNAVLEESVNEAILNCDSDE